MPADLLELPGVGRRDRRDGAEVPEHAARGRRADAVDAGEHLLGLGRGRQRGTPAPRGQQADLVGVAAGALGQPGDPARGVLRPRGLQDGDALLDELADRAAELLGQRVDGEVLDDQHGRGPGGQQALGLLEEPPVAQRRAEVAAGLALDADALRDDVVPDGELRAEERDALLAQELREPRGVLAVVVEDGARGRRRGVGGSGGGGLQQHHPER